jgi:hypothetical protein
MHPWFNVVESANNTATGNKEPGFMVAIGGIFKNYFSLPSSHLIPYTLEHITISFYFTLDIFKHYYKNNMEKITSKSAKKKKNRTMDDDEGYDDEDNDAYINDLVLKSLKVSSTQ